MSEFDRKYVNGHKLLKDSDFGHLTDEQKDENAQYKHVVIGGLQQCMNCGAAEAELVIDCPFTDEVQKKIGTIGLEMGSHPGFLNYLADLLIKPAATRAPKFMPELNMMPHIFGVTAHMSAAERHGVMKMDWNGKGWPDIISLERGRDDRRTYIYDKQAIDIKRNASKTAQELRDLQQKLAERDETIRVGQGQLDRANTDSTRLRERLNNELFISRNNADRVTEMTKTLKSWEQSEDILKRQIATKESQYNESFSALHVKYVKQLETIESLDSDVAFLKLDKDNLTEDVRRVTEQRDTLLTEVELLRGEKATLKEQNAMIRSNYEVAVADRERLVLQIKSLLGGNTVNVPRYQLRKVFTMSLEGTQRFALVDLGRTGAYFNDPVVIDNFSVAAGHETQADLIEWHVKALNNGQATKTVDPASMPKTLSGKYAADLYEEFKVKEN